MWRSNAQKAAATSCTIDSEQYAWLRVSSGSSIAVCGRQYL